MKQLLAGVVILFVVGFGSFLYRNTVERPGITAAIPACTMEAKICPDGTSVGRTGPACEFSPCAFPNVEIPRVNIAFLLPEGYAEGADGDGLLRLEKPSAGGWPPHTINVYRYEIPEGKTVNDVILENTRYQPADMAAEDFSQFRDLSVNGRTFRETTIERFEALVHSSYYLVRENDVLRFDIIEHDVASWMEPSLSIRDLPEHAALLSLLRTLQTGP